MFCASNDTTLVWYRLACSEKISPDENNNFWSKSWNTHSHKVNATHWFEALKWYFYDVLCFQWHHTRRISTRLFREDLSRRKQQFWWKSWNTHSHKVNATHWTETLKWYFYDVMCTTLVWYRLACSEKTSPDENNNFGQNHEIHILTK